MILIFTIGNGVPTEMYGLSKLQELSLNNNFLNGNYTFKLQLLFARSDATLAHIILDNLTLTLKIIFLFYINTLLQRYLVTHQCPN